MICQRGDNLSTARWISFGGYPFLKNMLISYSPQMWIKAGLMVWAWRAWKDIY